MKYFLTCSLGLALFLTPVLAQKKKVTSKDVKRPATPVASNNIAKKNVVGPKLTMEPLRYDFGKIKDTGDPISHAFLIKNEGTSDLEIESVFPSCGCTTAGFDKVIAPGQMGKIELTLKSLGVGKFEKAAAVTTNDPNKKQFTLVMKVEVFAPPGIRLKTFIVDSPLEETLTIKQGAPFEKIINFSNYRNTPVELRAIDRDNDYFDYEMKEVKAGSQYALILKGTKAMKELEPGQYGQIILLNASDDSPKSVISLVFTLNVVK